MGIEGIESIDIESILYYTFLRKSKFYKTYLNQDIYLSNIYITMNDIKEFVGLAQVKLLILNKCLYIDKNSINEVIEHSTFFQKWGSDDYIVLRNRSNDLKNISNFNRLKGYFKNKLTEEVYSVFEEILNDINNKNKKELNKNMKILNVVESNSINKKEYPEVPFVVKCCSKYYLIVKAEIEVNKYDGNKTVFKYIDLDNGCIQSGYYDTLNELFKESNYSPIYKADIIIKEKY